MSWNVRLETDVGGHDSTGGCWVTSCGHLSETGWGGRMYHLCLSLCMVLRGAAGSLQLPFPQPSKPLGLVTMSPHWQHPPYPALAAPPGAGCSSAKEHPSSSSAPLLVLSTHHHPQNPSSSSHPSSSSSSHPSSSSALHLLQTACWPGMCAQQHRLSWCPFLLKCHDSVILLFMT